jgi:hypothetical protein
MIHNVSVMLQAASDEQAKKEALLAKRREYMRHYRQTEEGQRAAEEAVRKYAMSEKGRLARARASAKYRAKKALGVQDNNEKRVAGIILYRWEEMPEAEAKKFFDELSASGSERWKFVADALRLRNKNVAEGRSNPMAHQFMREFK